jgi:hypothetical protein
MDLDECPHCSLVTFPEAVVSVQPNGVGCCCIRFAVDSEQRLMLVAEETFHIHEDQ